MDKNTILITGAAGNLGGLLAGHLKGRPLHLLTHSKDVADELRQCADVLVFKADLARRETLEPALRGVDTVVHFAGVLFRAQPEKFLPVPILCTSTICSTWRSRKTSGA